MLRRYAMFQIPGWIAVLTVMAVLYVWLDLSAWYFIAVIAALLIKDLVLYPITKHSYDPVKPPAHARLLGKTVVPTGDAESGMVRLDGELWRARTPDDQPLPPGRRGTVVALRGLTLIVRLEG